MEVTVYNQATQRKYDSRIAKIRVNRKGKISFNLRAIEILRLKEDGKINFIQNKNKLRDWYIESTKEEDGLILKKSSSRGLAIFSRTIARAFLNAISDNNIQSQAFIISSKIIEGKYHAIITHANPTHAIRG